MDSQLFVTLKTISEYKIMLNQVQRRDRNTKGEIFPDVELVKEIFFIFQLPTHKRILFLGASIKATT